MPPLTAGGLPGFGGEVGVALLGTAPPMGAIASCATGGSSHAHAAAGGAAAVGERAMEQSGGLGAEGSQPSQAQAAASHL